MARLLEYIFIFYFVLSLIPSMRERFKKGLRQLFIYLGVMLLIVSLIMSFYVYPRLLRLYEQTDMTLEPQKWVTYLVMGSVIAISLIIYGLKRKDLSKISTTSFYLHFGTLLILSIIFIELVISSIILPIYNLTSSFK